MKAKDLIEALLECGPEVDVEVALEHEDGHISFFPIMFVSPSDVEDFSSLINLDRSGGIVDTMSRWREINYAYLRRDHE